MKQLTEEYPVSVVCGVLGISRNAYYNYLSVGQPKDVNDERLKEKIEVIILDCPGYGYRRITRELSNQSTWVNHKKVLRIMSKYNLIGAKKKTKFAVTTDSNHKNKIYPNLVKGTVATGPNQIWVSDITYIPTLEGFVYLAFILDTYSRKVVGFNVGDNLTQDLVIKALEMALNKRSSKKLVHHSDRGVQYTASGYIALLKTHDIQISMAAKGNPYENAYAETFVKSLKAEEVKRYEYETRSEAEIRIANYITNYYNARRLHSALNYESPERFESNLKTSRLSVPN